MITTLLSFIVVIGIIIFVHESGHFIAAKFSGVRVEMFSLGFPPKIFSKKYGETEYQLAWIPLGGFVKMTGMIDESFDDDFDPDDPKAFINKNFFQRAFIITAGVLMNFLLAWVIYTAVLNFEGVTRNVGTTLSEVSEGYPAEEAGLQIGDKVLAIAGEDISEWSELTGIIRENPDNPIEFVFLRGADTLSVIATPKAMPSFNLETGTKDTVGQLGVLGETVNERIGLGKSLLYGGAQVIGIIELNVLSIKMLVTRQAGVSDLAGPIGIAKMSGEQARSGFVSFISFIGFISVAIGFLNILPIPMLDGGHLAFMIIEAIIRRPIPDKIRFNLMKFGMAALLLLIVVVSYHDIIRVFFK